MMRLTQITLALTAFMSASIVTANAAPGCLQDQSAVLDRQFCAKTEQVRGLADQIRGHFDQFRAQPRNQSQMRPTDCQKLIACCLHGNAFCCDAYNDERLCP
jgi:hypothetical protein